MLRTSVLTSTLLLSSFANAFYDSVPIVSWSPTQFSEAIQSLKDHVPHVPSQAQVLNSLMRSDDLCSLDAIVIVGQPGLHANQLASLSSESYIKTRLEDAASKAHFPYVPVSSVATASDIARDISAFCGTVSAEWVPGQAYERSVKRVLHFDLPESMDKSWAASDAILEDSLSEISLTFNSYAVFLTGTSGAVSPLIAKRQQPNSLSSPNFSNGATVSYANVTEPTGGILARYQLLTPGLLTGLLIAFGLLIPILMVGINALASIQNPIRTEAPKGPSLEKKNQ